MGDGLEAQVQVQAQHLLVARGAGAEAEAGLSGLFQRLADEGTRVALLRFVDVLPVLEDAEVAEHLREYFGADGPPLPGLAHWGLKVASGGLAAPLVGAAARRAVSHLARHFLAGEGEGQVTERAAGLWQQGRGCSLDLLGEAVVSEVEADVYQGRYMRLLRELPRSLAGWPERPVLDRCAGRPCPRLNLSIKLSSLYSQITPRDPEGSIRAVAQRLRPLLQAAREVEAFVYFDMEDYRFKGVILATFRRLLQEPDLADWSDVGIALQTYLRETPDDLRELAKWARARGAPVTVRLVRGAYWDLETTEARRQGWASPVWDHKTETDAAYEACLEQLFGAWPHLEAAVATHNPRSLAVALALAEQQGRAPGDFEFQQLHGMDSGWGEALVQLGHRLRIYTPFGELLPGMAYLVRRLLENSESQSLARLSAAAGADDVFAPPPPPSGSQQDVALANEPHRRFTSPEDRRRFAAALEQVAAELGQEYPLWIGGEAQWPGVGLLESHNPARPGQRVGAVALAGLPQIDQAVAVAREAGQDWGRRPQAERSAVLWRAAALLRQRRDRFAAWEVYEAGKTWAEADADVCEAIDLLRYYADQAESLMAPRGLRLRGEDNTLEYRPHGVGVILPPWNFPLAILTGMSAAAIAVGNTIVLKPSSRTPVVAARWLALLEQAGLPPGVVNLLFGPGGEVGQGLVRQPGVFFVAFTGSREVGLRLLRQGAEVKGDHLTHVVAEMGGKNAVIVDTDADPDEAIEGVLASAFGYAGQKCSAASRLILVGGGRAAWLRRLVEAASSLVIGDPAAPGTFLGPVIDSAARARILGFFRRASADARVLLGPDERPLPELGSFLGPTILSEVDPDSELAQEEVFGPLLAVIQARDFDHALRIANGTRYALTGGLWSRSPAHLARARREFQVGNLYLNRGITGALVGRQPFGGFRLSGVGAKAGGEDYLRQFVVDRCITEDTLRKGYAPRL